MRVSIACSFICALTGLVRGGGRFFYEGTSDLDQGIMSPGDWGQVECDDRDTCAGWPSHWHSLTPFIPENISNTCYDCADKIRDECRYHKQSPIDLWRNVTAFRDCRDRHRMHFQRGTCKFEDTRFEILPHVLRASQPESHCSHHPVIDFSFGFPDPWLLAYTDVVVPSLHRQDGRQYDGEVIMSHTYSVDKADKRIGNVAFFLEKGTEEDHYDFLELYIQRWRQQHQLVLRNCGKGERRANFEKPLNVSGAEPRNLGTKPPTQKLNYPYFARNFNPYDWYVQTRTHYYFRYEGSTTEPPCIEGVHWRVLKNPVVVAPSQISELQSLLANRVDPDTCQPYTAARVENDGSVHVNRPLQIKRPAHMVVYCECVDWESNTLSDRRYCRLSPEERGVITRTKRPSAASRTGNPTVVPTTAPSPVQDPCDCPTEKSRYLCHLFQLIHPDETPLCV